MLHEPVATLALLGPASVLAMTVAACGPRGGPARPPPPFAGVAGPLVIAHRGGALEAPENTLAAVAHGIASGADWQEIDVALTRDDAVVVIHDDTLERTTDGAGAVAAQALASIRRLSAGRPRVAADDLATLGGLGVAPPVFGDRFAGERVPTLAEVLALEGGRLLIELKRASRPVALVERVIADVHRAGAADRVAFGSLATELLDAAYQREPSIPLVGIVAEEREIEATLRLPIVALAVSLDLIEAARALAAPQIGVWAWTAYSTAMAEDAVARGAHGVVTDVPAAVIAAFRTPPPPPIPLGR